MTEYTSRSSSNLREDGVLFVCVAVLCGGAPLPQIDDGGHPPPLVDFGPMPYLGNTQLGIPAHQALDNGHLVLLQRPGFINIFHPEEQYAQPSSRNIFNQQQLFVNQNSQHSSGSGTLSSGGNFFQKQELESGTRNLIHQQTVGKQVESAARSFFTQNTNGQRPAIPSTFSRGISPTGTSVMVGQGVESQGRNFFRPQLTGQRQVILDPSEGDLNPYGKVKDGDDDARRFPSQQSFNSYDQTQQNLDNILTAQDKSRGQNIMPQFFARIQEQGLQDMASNSISIENFDDTRFRSSRPMEAARYRQDRPELSQGNPQEAFDDGVAEVRSFAQLPQQSTGERRLQHISSEAQEYQQPASFTEARSRQQQFSVSFEGSGFGYGYSVRGGIASNNQQSSALSGSGAALPVLMSQ